MAPPMHRWPKPAFAAFLLAYFLFFTYDGLRVHFAVDDIGNMAHYYRGGPLALAISQFTLWHGDYRPMGGLFYVPILAFAGLNPVPYQAALLLILLANVYLAYRLARLLDCGELSAGVAALIVSYHAGLHNLYYNAAFVYDALCCFFYLAALVYYVRIRQAGRVLTIRQIAIFLALYLGALNSKEMAVTLPLMLLVYEWIYHRSTPTGAATVRRCKGIEETHSLTLGALTVRARIEAATVLALWRAILALWRAILALWRARESVFSIAWRTIFCAGVLTLIDIYGKVFGPEAMVNAEAYHPVFVLRRVRDFQRMSLGDLLFGWGSGWGGILLLWAVLAYLAWRRDRPALQFLWWFMLLTPLPIEFLVGKSQACLYIPMVGWAIFGSVVLIDLTDALAAILEREWWGRRIGRTAIAAILLAVALFLWARQNLHYKRMYAEPVMASLGHESWDVIEQFRALNPHVRPASKVAFLDDPFHSWDMLFVAELWFRDRTLEIHVQRHGPLTPEELAKTDYIFTFDKGKLVQLK